MYLFVRKQGDAILEQLTLIQCKDESELSYYVQKSLRQCENSAKDEAESGKDENSAPAVANGLKGKQQQQKMEQLKSSNNSAKSVDDLTSKMSSLRMGGGTTLPPTHTLPRTLRPDFPLPTTQLNSSSTTVQPLPCTAMANGNAGGESGGKGLPQHPPIPLIRSSEDLGVLCEYTSRTLNMPQLNYAAIRAQAAANPSIRTVAEAEVAVAQARDRLENFKTRLLQQQQQL